MLYNHNINAAAVHLIDILRTAGAANYLELGCWTGALGNYQVDRYGAKWIGIEGSLEAINSGLHRFKVYNYDLNKGAEGIAPLIRECDTLVMVDVLEHLYEPLEFLKEAIGFMKKNATIIVVLPNIGCHQVVEKLLAGSFAYEDSGILDRTHRYFWTPNSFLKDCKELGLTPVHGPIFLRNGDGEDLLQRSNEMLGYTFMKGPCYEVSLKCSGAMLESLSSYGFAYALGMSDD